MPIDTRDILLTVPHPFGDVETTLADWIRVGPGARPLLCPVGAKRASTGEPLPLRVVPLRYRNNGWSRLFIRLGVLADPWK